MPILSGPAPSKRTVQPAAWAPHNGSASAKAIK
jgi:hypothetical protein